MQALVPYLVEEQPVALDNHKFLLFTQVSKINVFMVRLRRVQGAVFHSAGYVDEQHAVY